MSRNLSLLPKGTLVPKHIAIIPDGNRRWARARNLPTLEGHRAGFDLTPKLAKAARQFGVHTLTLWAFSTENWDRSKEEVAYLMKHYEKLVKDHLIQAKKDKARIIHLGRKDRIPKSLAEKLQKAEEETKNNKRYVFNIAMDYGGKDEILRASKKMLQDGITANKLDEKIFASYLDTADQPYPYPDLIIRTSGEQRLSGFLTWQGVYAELYFLPEHFPDFSPDKLKEAILDFSRRRRRFGGNDLVPKVGFNPEKIAQLETAMLKADDGGTKDQGYILGWLKELYGLSVSEARNLSLLFFKALRSGEKQDWRALKNNLRQVYAGVKRRTKFVFNPEVVAGIEADWWKFKEKFEAENILRKLYGEIYRLSDLQCFKIAHLRSLAASAVELAKRSKDSVAKNKLWKQAQNYLLKSYQALREAAS